jgi:hypothetical protein
MPSVPQMTESGAAPRHLQSLLIRGGEAPDVHLSFVAGEGQGPTPATAGTGGLAPKRTGERVATVEAVNRNGAAPESAGPKRVAPE